MVEQYKILYQGGREELIEKKSRFIATAKPVTSESEAIEFIDEMKKTYWDASHNCSAYVIGERGQIKRCSDDGEPSQTAGRPMLDVIEGEQIYDLCVVVTRYFGGTLLGTGGLVRAYSGAVKEVLQKCQVLEKKFGRQIAVFTDYNGIGKLQYLFNQLSIVILDTQYTEQVEIKILVPVGKVEQITEQITEESHGRAIIQLEDEYFYGINDKKVILFENEQA